MKWLSVLVCCSVLINIGGCSESETALTHINKAKTYIDEDKFNESIIELKNAIKKAPDNADARFLLGQLYLQQGSGLNAVKELEKAQEYNYSPAKVLPLLARAYILVDADTDILALNDQAKLLPDDVQMRYLAYKTLAAIRTENIALAVEASAQANSFDSVSLYSMMAMAYLNLAEKQIVKANTQVLRVLAAEPKNPDALMLQGQIATAMNDHARASSSYLQFATLQPKSSVVILFLADSLLKEQKYSAAEKYADIILSTLPNQPFAHYVKATALFELKAYRGAKRHAESALLSNFNWPYLKLIAGVSSYFLNNFEQSHYHLNSIVQYLTPDHPARKIFALSQLQLGLVGEISDTLSGFTSVSKADDKFLSSLSYQLAELGAYQDAKALASQVSTHETDGTASDAEQKVREGMLKLVLNDPSGIQNLKAALAQSPDMLSAELALAYAAIQTGDFDQALDISEKWKNEYPDNPGGYNVLAGVYLKKGKLTKAKEALLQSLAIAPNNLFALTELTLIAQQQKHDQAAKHWSEMAVTAFPANVKILRQHYGIFKDESAFAKIKTLFETNKADLSYGMLYAEVLLDTDNIVAADQVLASYTTSIISPKKLWQLMLFVQKKQDNDINYQRLLAGWLKTNPYHIEPVLLLVKQFVNKKQADKALVLINKSLAGPHKDNKMLKMAKMHLLLEGKLLREAKNFYSKLESVGMNKKLSQGFQGRIYLLEQNYAQAIPLLAAYYHHFPSSQNIILLASSLQGDNQLNAAITSLESHLVSNENDDKVRGQLANLYLQAQPDKAISHYEKMLSRLPNNIVALNNLAWLNIAKGELETALLHSKKAIGLAPENPNVVDTRGMVLLKTENRLDAWKASSKAYKISKGQDMSIALNYAEVLISINENQKALDVLRKVVNNSSTKQRKNSLITLAKKNRTLRNL
ncbi:XrtA/PEP-CTERM system TPR-repeat protein PrsT [Colwellia sp. C1TZA3]|uniref:XrtA/PEP-CTERM system TPR-repeat protein PrsT n=1 Tax=Colwellia sp. C1TZA3 TaxID=2508879 RepID=UPI0011BA16DC|nr:XrtA/PEP-CTERM system TPR-repeat protein PrsT [Colwellia sp. C1TZA3]TWX65420.1 PEP-CTERM system TPR-repeat protein PrsT [Colwellia sp. C1TZA3]